MARFSKALSLKAAILSVGLLALLLFLINGVSKSTVLPTELEPAKNNAVMPHKEGQTTAPKEKTSQSMPIYTQWRTYTTREGMPSDKATCVRVDGERVWVGTNAGLVCYDSGRFRTYTVADGLAHPMVLSVDISSATGDVWIATMGGLNRWSAGRFDKFDQFNSGLANDVVYAVACQGKYVWAATASGASRFNTYTGQWSIFDHTNVPMHEPWTYSVSANDGMVYIAAWGGGVLEFNSKTDVWKDYRDPDGEMELDIFPNDELVHDVTASVSYENQVLWVGTYFGLNRFDGTRWWGYFDHDSGLASNFINFVKARGSVVWICTDKGLNSFDGTTWVTYRRDATAGRGEILLFKGAEPLRKQTSPTALAHNFVMGIDFQGETLWVATAEGLSRGVAQSELTASIIKR